MMVEGKSSEGFPQLWVGLGQPHWRCEMVRLRAGVVVGKDYRPPHGKSSRDWCYLIVDLTDGDRVAVRLDSRQVDTAILGDRVEFRTPRRPDKKLSNLRRLNPR